MRTLHLFGSLLFLSFISNDAISKTINLGYAFRINDKYDSNAISSMVNGIKAAALKYGVEKKVKVNLIEYAYGNDLASITKTAEKIKNDGIKIIIGPEMSDEAIVLGDILSPEKIALISPTASNPNISKGRPYVFSTCFSDKYVSIKLAKFVTEKFKFKTIGVLKELGSSYSEFLASSFLSEIKKINPGVNLIEKKYMDNSMKFDQAIKEFKEKSVEAVAVLSYESSLLEFNMQALKQGYHPVYIGSDGWGTNRKIFDNLVEKSSGGKRFIAYRSTYWKTESKTEETEEFKFYLKKITKNQMNEWNAMAYDTAMIAFDAANSSSGIIDGDQIKKYLMKNTFRNLVTTKKLKINLDGTAEKDIHIYKIDKRGIHFEETL